MIILIQFCNYNDSKELIQNYKYLFALEKAENKDWDSAIEILSNIVDYQDSKNLMRQYNINKILNIQPNFPEQYEIPENPIEVEDFEKMLLHMARFNQFEYTVKYTKHYTENNIADTIVDNSILAHDKIFEEYPEYFSFLSHITSELHTDDNTLLYEVSLKLWEKKFDNKKIEKMTSNIF